MQPNQFRVWLQHVFAADSQLKSRNMVFYSVLAKQFKLELKTARQSFNDLMSSKQETSIGTACRHLEMVPFPVEHVLPPAVANVLFWYLSSVAKWYQFTKLPGDPRQYRSLVRRRFRTGVSLAGCEASQLVSQLVQDVALPLPYHVLFLSIYHLVVLIYSSSLQRNTKKWRIWGMVHVFLMHLVLEYSEEGSTQTLYCHGLEHVFQLPWLPIGCTDEAGERDLRLGKRFASLRSNVADKSIAQTMGHEMYVKFLGCRARRFEVHLWHPERRGVVMEQCVVSAPPMWRAVFERLLGKVLQDDTFKCYMHVATQSIFITTNACLA